MPTCTPCKKGTLKNIWRPRTLRLKFGRSQYSLPCNATRALFSRTSRATSRSLLTARSLSC